MSSSPEILKALSQTTKGRLKYDNSWFEDGRLQCILEDLCRAPTVSVPVSPNVSLTITVDDEQNATSLPSSGSGRNKDSLGVASRRDARYGFSPQSNASYSTSTETLYSKDSSYQQDILNKSSQSDKSPGTKHNKVVSPSKSPRSKTSHRAKDGGIVPAEDWVERAIINCERQCKEKVQDKIRQKQEDLKRQLILIQQQAETKQIELEMVMERHMRMTERQIQDYNHAKSQEVKQRQQKLKEHHRMHARLLDVKRREAEAKQQQLEEDFKKRDEDAKKRVAAIAASVRRVDEIRKQMADKINSCSFKDKLPESVTDTCPQLVNAIFAQISEVCKQSIETGDVPVEAIQHTVQKLSKAQNALEIVTNAIKKKKVPTATLR